MSAVIATEAWPSCLLTTSRRAPKSSSWVFARTQQLQREPNCRVCGEKANAVDHIVAISQGGAELDPVNLQSLCRRHHNTKTTSEGHAGMKRAAKRRKNPP